MNKFTTSLLMLFAAIICLPQSSFAEEYSLTPTQTTVIQADGTTQQNSDVVLYNASATAWRCSQAKISGGAFSNVLANYDGSPVVITKFDASEILNGKTLKKATLTFNSKCTVSGKNSNVQIASIGTGWDATTATWNNTNKGDILNAVNLNGDGVNVKTSIQTLTQDVTEALSASEDNTIGFAIYTFTGREQETSNFTLTIEAIDASASSTYTVKYVDGNGNEIKASDERSESIGAAITLKDTDKAPVYNEDKTVKYIYVSDDAEGQTVASDGATVVTVTFREAATWNYTINAVDGEGNLLKTLKTGTNFEAEVFNVAYGAYINVDGTIWKSSKLSSDKKGYYFSMDLNQDNLVKDVTFTASDITGVVYFSEAEDIEGLTLTNNNNTFVRSSNGASAYAKDGDVVFTSVPNGKYKIGTVICDASKNAGSVWNFKAGDTNVFEFTATSVNWAEGTSEEFELNAASTDIALVQGGGNTQGVDLIYIIKTGDAELAAPTPAQGVMDFIAMNLPVSSGSGASYVAEGDITEEKTFTEDDFTVTISTSTTSIPNRFWSANGGSQLRMYSGTLTVKAAAGKILTKIVYNNAKWNKDNTANVGTLTGNTWTGEAEEVVLTVAGNTQINNVTVGETPAAPLADAANIAAFKALEDGTKAKLAVNGAKVTFVNGDNAYIEDETGALLLYKSGLTLTANKALTGYINGAHSVYNGLDELTAIDETAASEFTEADAEITATVMTVAEASTADAVSKLVKLENVNINADYQKITQGEDEISFYDKFKVMGEFTYPTVVKSIVGIIHTSKGYNSFCPVGPEYVEAGEVTIPEVANIAAAKADDVRGQEIKLNVTGAKLTLNAGTTLDAAFIEDETGAIMIDRDILNTIGADVKGAALTGYIVGKVAKDQTQGGQFVMSASDNTAAASQVTNEETTLESTPTTIADILAGQVCDVTSKYISLSNVKLIASEYDAILSDGENEISLYDANWVLPYDMSTIESFKSIQGIVTYIRWNGGLTFVPFGDYEAVEKSAVKVDNLAALKGLDNGTYVELTLKDAQVTVYERDEYGMGAIMVLEDETCGIQIMDQSGNNGEATIFTELGQTFNGTMYLQYSQQDLGFVLLATQQTPAKSEYTVEVKDVVAKDVALSDAKSENYSMQLIKVSNVTIGETEDGYQTLSDGVNTVIMADLFYKSFDEEGNLLPYKKFNLTGFIMSVPTEYDDDYNPIDYTDYFIPTVVENAATDGINGVDADVLANGAVYTINGVKVRNAGESLNGLAKGMYIIGGKKVVIK